MTRRALIPIAAGCAALWFAVAVLIGGALIAAHRATRDDVVSTILCAAMLALIVAGSTLYGRRPRGPLEPLGTYRDHRLTRLAKEARLPEAGG